MWKGWRNSEALAGLDIYGVRLGEFVKSMLTVCASDARLAAARMEALHGLEILPVNVSLAEPKVATCLKGGIDVVRVDG